MDIPLEDLPDRRGRNRRVPGELSSGQLSRLRGWLEGEKRLSEHQMVRPVTAAVMIFMLLLAGLGIVREDKQYRGNAQHHAYNQQASAKCLFYLILKKYISQFSYCP